MFERLKDIWAFMKYKKEEEKLNDVNESWKLRRETDKPKSQEKYKKVIELEQVLEKRNTRIRAGVEHWLIDPRPELRIQIDQARLDAGCPLVYHTEKEWPEVSGQYYEAQKRRQQLLQRLKGKATSQITYLSLEEKKLKKRLSAAADKPLVKKVSKSR